MMVEWRNEDRMAVIEIELTEWNCQNRGFLLVESSKSRPLIGREDPQKKSKGLTLIRKCPSFLRHSLIQTSFNSQSCHSGMRISGLEWWDDAELTWMSLGWAHSIVMPSFQCHPIILVAFHHSKHSKQGGLTLASLRFQKVSPPIILCRGWWVDWLVPLNDIEWLEWFWNDGLKVEWCPLSFQGVASSQSTHHPLQRMMGGLTCRFEWFWMIRMI